MRFDYEAAFDEIERAELAIELLTSLRVDQRHHERLLGPRAGYPTT